MGLLSIILSLGVANSVFLAALVVRNGTDVIANRLLATLLMLVALRLCIYVLGFAGAYDAHPWLTFAPLDMSAGFAPLLWLYVRAKLGRFPRDWRVHLVPAAIQLLYQLICFALPLDAKWEWYTTSHLPLVAPAAMWAILFAGTVYLALCWCEQAKYQAWLDTRFADREHWRLGWLRVMIAAFAVLLGVTVAAAAWHAFVHPLDYFGRAPIMFGFCLLAYVLGLFGWRHSETVYSVRAASEADSFRRTDYIRQAEIWTRRIEAQGWWREEGLTLGEVAHRLGTSERSLSRALNGGSGENFNRIINAMRVSAIKRALADPDEARDLLTLALDYGFSSKASFNRAFRQVVGLTPSAWRSEIRQGTI
ncbi:AraC family transcriptional regulator [Sphingomonas sp. HF-S4]|uniref:AraC family transcriptional regulator n=1 Tax=Sphingomonas agrestis TaxID=3080540 RepID=A0ABU3Y280_9SPHN|nr:AraC family transcriptional regulator [Sphingomonas sp. HF-S4]MDV3455348.1 AraC family transcriptional regulator [Sphingomonas sp. HF-S4]